MVAHTGGVEDGVAQRGGHPHHRHLAEPDPTTAHVFETLLVEVHLCLGASPIPGSR